MIQATNEPFCKRLYIVLGLLYVFSASTFFDS